MTKLEAWKQCRYLWQDQMRIEAASVGYDFEAGAAVRESLRKASAEYQEEFREEFDPEKKPEEETFGGLFSDLGARLEYAKYLETCRGRGLDFEEWVAERVTVGTENYGGEK